MKKHNFDKGCDAFRYKDVRDNNYIYSYDIMEDPCFMLYYQKAKYCIDEVHSMLYCYLNENED